MRTAMNLLAAAALLVACNEQSGTDGPQPPERAQADSESSPNRAADTTAASSFRAWQDQYGCRNTASVTQRFTPARLVSYPTGDVDAPAAKWLLLSERLEIEQRDDCGAESAWAKGKLSVVAAPYDERGIGKRAWSLEALDQSGNLPAGELWPFAELPALYRVGYGDVGIYYSLHTGERLFAATDRLLRVELPRSPLGARFIAYHDGRSLPLPSETARDEKVIGVIQYGDDRSVFERLLLASDARIEYDHARVELVLYGRPTYFGWGMMRNDGIVDRRQIDQFAVAVHLHASQWQDAAPQRIEIPIEADEFDVAAARLPAGVSIRR